MAALFDWLVAAACLFAPGYLVTTRCGLRRLDRVAGISDQAAAGLAFWPVAFLLTTSVGVHWQATAVRLLLGAMMTAAIALKVREHLGAPASRRQGRRRPGGSLPVTSDPPAGSRRSGRRDAGAPVDAVEWTAWLIAAIVTLTRIAHIRGVALPLWVDSVHHTMIVRLLVDQGTIPDSYSPWIEGSVFYYHWGYHSIMAVAAWVRGATTGLDIARLILNAGQLFNTLIFFAVYNAGAALFRSRRTALLAATLATLVSFFPAYYVSWGRYTQLTGLLILPPLLVHLWKLGRHPTIGRAAYVALLTAGLLLIHVRVSAVVAVFAILASAILLLQHKGRGVAWCAAAATAGILLASPWLVHLARTPQVRTILAPSGPDTARWETSNDVPDDLLRAPHNILLMILATGGIASLTPIPHLSIALRIGGIALVLMLVFLIGRRSRRRKRAVRRVDGWRLGLLACWVLLTALLINLDRLGLPRLRLLPNSAAVIMLFLPLSLAGAMILRWIVDVLAARRRMVAMLALTFLIGIFGALSMRSIINPVTLLVTEGDRQALLWIASHTPATARFAVGVQPWIGGAWIGTDGGYWIPLIAGRESILPPGLYPWVLPAGRVEAITRRLEACHEAEEDSAEVAIERLRGEGVTHIYFGPANATPLRATIGTSSLATCMYDRDGVQIYELAGLH